MTGRGFYRRWGFGGHNLSKDGIDNLRYAIVVQACQDYVKAVKKRDTYAMAECERFFRSQWYELLCDVEGEALIRELKKRALSKKGRIIFSEKYSPEEYAIRKERAKK